VAAAARVLGRRVGLRLDPAVQSRLARCVQEAASARRQDEADFVASLDRDPAALQELLDRVTVQETSFFRDPGQFETLATHVLPTLRGPVTAWSAGCANGQEAYTVAMVLAESAVSDWRVVASDISTRALDRARQARYSEKELRGVDARRRDAHFTREGAHWRIATALRDRVSVSRLNLAADPLPGERGTCSIVFCRNVLIYFKPEEVVAFLERLARWMPPDGYLFLGYSESLWQVTDAFKLVRLGPSFVYRPAVGGAPAPVPRSASAGRPRPPAAAAPAPPPTPRPGPSASERTAAERRAADDLPDVPSLLAEGEAAAAAGEHEAAVAAFRKAAYLEPDHPITHLHLGLALEAAGHGNAAARAYKAGRAAVERCDTAAVEAALEGYRLDELVALLDAKLGGT
jgi:chemotaxis protein methyltransferase CheR